jgi:hypothetical protein
MTELICPACGRGYYTAMPAHQARGVECDVCPRELVAAPIAGGMLHLPEPVELQARRQQRFDELEAYHAPHGDPLAAAADLAERELLARIGL